MSRKKTSLATPLAPEDIRRGDDVAVLHEIEQWIPWCGDAFGRPEPLNIRLLPSEENAAPPLKVVEVCLPFVTARKPDGSLVTLDVRRHELARLDAGYARRVTRLLVPKKRKSGSARSTRGQ